MFGKIENGCFIPAPSVVVDEEGTQLYLPTEETYLRFGYLPCTETAKPAGQYVEEWAEENGRLIQRWAAGVARETAEDKIERLRKAFESLETSNPINALAVLLQVIKAILQ